MFIITHCHYHTVVRQTACIEIDICMVYMMILTVHVFFYLNIYMYVLDTQQSAMLASGNSDGNSSVVNNGNLFFNSTTLTGDDSKQVNMLSLKLDSSEFQ